MRSTHVPVQSCRTVFAPPVATRLATLALLAGIGCKDANQPVGVEPGRPMNFAPSTSAAGAPATFTDDQVSTRAASSENVVRIYKNHDAWRAISDGGRDEMSLEKMGIAKGADFFVHPMSSLASGVPAGTRLVIITANSTGDASTSEAQRSADAQEALSAFLRTGGTLLVDLADNEAEEGYRVPGATGTPSYVMPPKAVCAEAALAAAALGSDGVAGTADDHRFVRGPDGLAGTADDIGDETIDLAHGGISGSDRSAEPEDLLRGCSNVHGNLEDGFALPKNAQVLATATWPEGKRAVLGEYCHAGGRVIVNTFSLGYFGHRPREGAYEPIRSTYIQRSLYAYALSPESYCYPAPAITAPPDVYIGTDAGACNATKVNLGAPHVVHFADLVTVERRRGDGQPLDAPYPKGATTIMWTVTDARGETAAATQTVTVRDLEKPRATIPANKTVNNDAGRPTATIDVGSASATDNCGGAITVMGRRSDGAPTVDAPFFVGRTTITWSARDAAGNEGTAEQQIVVRDAEAPVLSIPASFTVNATTSGGASVQFAVSANDNVAVTSFSCDRSSGTWFPIGATTVSCSAADRAGNSSASSFIVTVDGAAEQIAKLISYVRGVLPTSPHQAELLDLLRKAQADVGSGAACDDLDAFLSKVSVNSGTMLPADKANRMIADATRIRSVLGCAAAP